METGDVTLTGALFTTTPIEILDSDDEDLHFTYEKPAKKGQYTDLLNMMGQVQARMEVRRKILRSMRRQHDQHANGLTAADPRLRERIIQEAARGNPFRHRWGPSLQPGRGLPFTAGVF